MKTNIYQLKKKIIFRQPRSWDVHIRYAIVFRGKDICLEPGTWLLEKGEVEYRLSDGPEKEYLYRLATGEMVALDRPLSVEDADRVTDPQIISAMSAFRTLEEAAFEDWNIHVEHIDPLPPFGLIKCPLCGDTDFSSVDFAGVWCDHCNARFEVRYTAGDPGFVVDCFWDHVDWSAVRYLIPRSHNLAMRMVFKNADDPRKMDHPDTDRQWYKDNYGCTPETPSVTGEESRSLRPGLHYCHLGNVYDWQLNGRVPSWIEMLEGEKNRMAWNVDGVMWPSSAYTTISTLTYGEESTLRSLSSVLRKFKDDDTPSFPLGLQEVVDTLDGLLAFSKTKVGPLLGRFDLPLLSELGEDERYLLHHWLIVHELNFELAYPIWYVVQPVLGEEAFSFRPIRGWTVVRRDICPPCGRRVMPEVYDKLLKNGNPSYETPHWNCLKLWKEMDWTLQQAEPEETETEEMPYEGRDADVELRRPPG